MIYTAPCVMLLMRADTLRGEVVGGLALEISSFVGPCEMARADRRVPATLYHFVPPHINNRYINSYYEPEPPFMHVTDCC